jgi:energy-coupling factor transporter ATP-binding protein EcfA2
MIKSLKVTGLNRRMSFELAFHEDINVVTGKNGSGKTTVLKLLWYAISGNLERIIQEIPFDSFELETDKSYVAMAREPKQKPNVVIITYRIGAGEKKTIRKSLVQSGNWDGPVDQAKLQLAGASGSSVFFPTFRRIEGGFSISTRPNEEAGRLFGSGMVTFYPGGDPTAIQQAMNQLSDRLSVGAHRFVASISTDDISRLLTSIYAEISQTNNRLHMDLSRFILQQVGKWTGDDPGANWTESQTRKTLKEIEDRALRVTRESEAMLQPFTVLSELITKIFQYRGIQLDGPVTLGEAREAIGSDLLSSGEKQMLSFLCYNAFASKSCIFIDEPEISLHVDWQRLLFPILLKQSTGNQFIVATHSPFIYSKYADKELLLAPDRGDEDADPSHDGAGDRRIPQENELADVAG